MSKMMISFEAKSIQRYILDSGKLKDMIGASEQIENLCAEGGLLDEVLDALGLSHQKAKENFSRRAGGAFTLFFNDPREAGDFYAAWSFCVQQQLPGLAFVLHKQSYETEEDLKTELTEKLPLRLEQARNQLFPQLPVPGPLVARARRTGGAAVDFEDGESLDAQTVCKRNFKSTALERKVDPEQAFTWPRYFDDDELDNKPKTLFPMLEHTYIGIVHADGNGLGGIIKKLINNLDARGLRSTLFEFSEAVRKATLHATRDAVNQVLGKYVVVPARPLVVGGDDWSFIARGDLAVDFTEKYLEAFEAKTREAFAKLSKAYPGIEFPSHLTACAGIVFVKPKQPFYQAYDLAESLCRYAKKRAKPQDSDIQTPSALAFYRLTNSQFDNYETIIERELTAGNIVLTMQPYFIGRGIGPNPGEDPNLGELLNLANHLQDPRISRGAVRELLDLLHADVNHAQQRFERWRENLRKAKNGKELEEDIMHSLFNLTGEPRHERLPGLLKTIQDIKSKKMFYASPLSDALALNSIRKGSEDDD